METKQPISPAIRIKLNCFDKENCAKKRRTLVARYAHFGVSWNPIECFASFRQIRCLILSIPFDFAISVVVAKEKSQLIPNPTFYRNELRTLLLIIYDLLFMKRPCLRSQFYGPYSALILMKAWNEHPEPPDLCEKIFKAYDCCLVSDILCASTNIYFKKSL